MAEYFPFDARNESQGHPRLRLRIRLARFLTGQHLKLVIVPPHRRFEGESRKRLEQLEMVLGGLIKEKPTESARLTNRVEGSQSQAELEIPKAGILLDST